MNPNRHLMTLDEFTFFQTKQFQHSTGELSTLLRDIALACKLIHKQVNKAGLTEILGAHGAVNVQGEEQMKLDVFANEVLISVLRNSADCAGIASEENDEIVVFNEDHSLNSKYVVLFDPLDGSSNIDVNASIGTIFCIYRRKSELGKPCTLEDFLQPGKNIMASGYVIYGSSTMMVYATRLGVNGFTLEQSIGEFCLSHKDMRCPVDGKTYSINQGNHCKFNEAMQQYLAFCMTDDKSTSRPYGHRYIGSMVADLHRTLIKGGIFMYPEDRSNPNGKLRLLYECNPMSHIIEMAGGRGVSGKQQILAMQPEALHQRIPILIGSRNMVERAQQMIYG